MKKIFGCLIVKEPPNHYPLPKTIESCWIYVNSVTKICTIQINKIRDLINNNMEKLHKKQPMFFYSLFFWTLFSSSLFWNMFNFFLH